jgi:hypothetical protein
MSDNAGIHWTDDEELLSRFVLGRISGARALGLEAHLASCERCRKAVEQERIVAAGVRRLGREELKRSIARNVHRTPMTVPWPKILAAAAVVVIAGGVLLYDRWTALEQERTPLNDNRPASIAEGRIADTGMTAQKSERLEKKKETAVPPPTLEKRRPAAPEEEAWIARRVADAGTSLDATASEAMPQQMEMASAPAPGGTLVTDARVVQRVESRRLGFDRGKTSSNLTPFPAKVELSNGRLIFVLFPLSPLDSASLAQAVVRKSGDEAYRITVGALTLEVVRNQHRPKVRK